MKLTIKKAALKEINSNIRRFRTGWTIDAIFTLDNDIVRLDKISQPMCNSMIQHDLLSDQFVVSFGCGNNFSSHDTIIEKIETQMSMDREEYIVIYSDDTPCEKSYQDVIEKIKELWECEGNLYYKDTFSSTINALMREIDYTTKNQFYGDIYKAYQLQ